MHRSLIETVMGAVVLVVAGLFVVFAFSAADLRAVGGYPVTASFEQTTGLNSGADVRISGIKVGSVINQQLDPATYLARITLSIDPALKLPRDTIAKVASEGLLGGTYMQLIPGGDDQMIEPGGRITYTQSSVDLLDLLGRFVFTAAESGGNQSGGNKPETTAPLK